MEILSASNLSKVYGLKRAVDNLSITVNEGDIYGFVGLNGAGKTTVIRLITGLIQKSGGSFKLFGVPDSANLDKVRRKTSSMVETPSIYLNMTAEDNLKMQCSILCADAKKIPDILDMVGLGQKSATLKNTKKQAAKNYSLGMRQRLGIAMALVGEPRFMMLDEPTNGLDPEGIIEVRDLLKKLNREMGITILVSSHILSELSRLATTYGFIHNGKLIEEISAENIQKKCGKSVTLKVDKLDEATKLLATKFNIARDGETIIIDGEPEITPLIHLLDSENICVSSLNTISRDLENYFINLIGGANL